MIDFIISIVSLIGAFVFSAIWNPIGITNKWLMVLCFLAAVVVLYIVLGALFIFVSFLISRTINNSFFFTTNNS